LVSQLKFLLTELHATAEALSNAEPFVVELARELEADAAQARTAGGVDLDAGGQLADYRSKVTGLETTS
jgi:hypothetical protein